MGDFTIGSDFTIPGFDFSKYTEQELKEMFIYDENGKIIGVKSAENTMDKIASEMQGIQMESMKVIHDRFVREAEATAAKNAATAEEASSKQTEVTKSYKDVTDIINALGAGGLDIEEFAPDYAKDANILKQMAEELTKPNASNTAVLNGVAKFMTAAQEFEEDMDSVKEQAKEAENEEAGVDADKYFETYNFETHETENYFANNPFWNSAFDTTEVEEDDVAVA